MKTKSQKRERQLSGTETLSQLEGVKIYGGIEQLKDGRLLALSPTGKICAKYSEDEGQNWSKLSPLRDRAGKFIKGGDDPSGLIRLASGKLMITYARKPADGIGREVFMRKSSNEGKNWGSEVRINTAGTLASNYHDTIIQLKTGRLVLPVRWCFAGGAAHAGEKLKKDPGGYGKVLGQVIKLESHAHYPELDVAFVYYSDDEGKTWHRSKEHIMLQDTKTGGIFPVDEPNIVERADGSIMMFGRTTTGQLCKSISEDGGDTWSLPEPTGLAASYSPCRLRRIPKTKDIVCIWNNVSTSETQNGFRRSRLSIGVSKDGGKTFRHIKNLACLGVPDKADIKPPKTMINIHSKSEMGAMPKDFGIAHYANIRFASDKAYILWFEGHFHKIDGKVKVVQQRMLKIVPISWLYS